MSATRQIPRSAQHAAARPEYLCRAVLHGECALMPPRERVQQGSGRVCGNLCYEAGKSRNLPCHSSRSLAETAVGGPQRAGDMYQNSAALL